jgi:hypothetical protein
VTGDRLSLTDGDPEVRLEVIHTYHYPAKRTAQPRNKPHTRLLVKPITDEEAKYSRR